MKLSYTTLATPGFTYAQSIEAARQYGYQGIDLRISGQPGDIPLGASDKVLAQIRRLLERTGIQASSLLAYNPAPNGELTSWRELEAYLRQALELANAVGAPAIRVFCKLPADSSEAWYHEQMAKLLLSVLEQDRSDVAILLQNHRSHATAGQLMRLLDRIFHPRMGMIFSPDHCMEREEELFDQLERILPYVRQLYVADVLSCGGRFPDVLPGQGRVPLKKIIRSFAEHGFDGWISFKWEKMHNPLLEGAEISLPYYVQFARNAINDGGSI
ncbi:sugar phosphate isomerase/epimerase family protein [Paenibacillus oryzisoli]|uniref:sugar phosphate isomerase/epimerase family protein n=1 Tax=Paenibacillus oryzisoli TaxID=1850517 RepID=UPI003D2D7DCA